MLNFISKVNARLLYLLARILYRSDVAHSSEMKQAFASRDALSHYRSAEFTKILAAAQRYGITFDNKVVLDLGCDDGAISPQFHSAGAKEVIGVDISAQAIQRAAKSIDAPATRFIQGEVRRIPLEDEIVDVIVSYDVFEHVTDPPAIIEECHRVLRPGGKMLVGTWGWYHPFAPHLWAVMPVPWAHVVFSERTIMKACRLVYQSDWYVPNVSDLDKQGNRLPNKYTEESIDPNHLNKYFISDFRRAFNESKFGAEFHLVPFGSRLARWTKVFLRVPWLRELFAGYLWIVCTKSRSNSTSAPTVKPSGFDKPRAASSIGSI